MDKGSFAEPPVMYRTVPFWSWNGLLDVEETRRQVRDMAAAGMGGGFMHSRSGLATGYLGEGWFANCAAAVEEGKRVGFHPWLYDEDRWPSGSCGGRTAEANPALRARVLAMERDGVFPGWVEQPDASFEREPLGRFRVKQKGVGRIEYAPAGEGEREDIVTVYSLVCPRSPWENGGYYPDLMNPDATREFIRNTYEEYAKRLGDEFGKAVPGVFTDEPQLRGPLPWSVVFADAFGERRGYDFLARMPSLFLPAADAVKVRHDYWKTVAELFSENYFGLLGKWCDERGLAFTGHMMAEGGLTQQVPRSGAVMPAYVHMAIPGIDILREKISEVITCKQASSVCNQFNKPRMLSETYGCTGYNFSFEGQKWIGDWQMALGVNLACQHLADYTMKSCAKRDYPPSYSYQSPWWRHFRHIADYQARLCYALCQGEAVRDILLIHPVSSALVCVEWG